MKQSRRCKKVAEYITHSKYCFVKYLCYMCMCLCIHLLNWVNCFTVGFSEKGSKPWTQFAMLFTWFLRTSYLNSNLRNCIYISVLRKPFFFFKLICLFFSLYWEGVGEYQGVEPRRHFSLFWIVTSCFYFCDTHYFIKIIYVPWFSYYWKSFLKVRSFS